MFFNKYILRSPDDKNGGINNDLDGLDDLLNDDDVNLDDLGGDDDDDSDVDENDAASFMTYKVNKRVSSLDISASSKQDHRFMTRFSKKEADEHLRDEFLRKMRKPVIKPFAIIKDFPYKKKASDKDIPDKNNVSEEFILIVGRLPKWRTIMHQLNERPYIIGECMYVHKGNYDIGTLKPHIALVISKKYKTIKPMEIRDCFDPVKAVMQNGAPYVIYKEFPKRLS
jgi:hypothetical protein